MSESLLGHSEVILFGRVVSELSIKADDQATVKIALDTVDDTKGHDHDGLTLAENDKVIVLRGSNRGLYEVPASDSANWPKATPLPKDRDVFEVKDGSYAGEIFLALVKDSKIRFVNSSKISNDKRKKGANKQLEDQFVESDARFARIYAFSFEGAYYELPQPALFLVHGDGESVTEGNKPAGQGSRAPLDPSVTGLPAADFQFSNSMQYWVYDKADYTIRMDIESGMFEQVLLDLMFEGDIFGSGMAGATVRGATVRGATVRGATVRGATVRGATVRGATVRGATVRGGGGGD